MYVCVHVFVSAFKFETDGGHENSIRQKKSGSSASKKTEAESDMETKTQLEQCRLLRARQKS